MTETTKPVKRKRAVIFSKTSWLRQKQVCPRTRNTVQQGNDPGKLEHDGAAVPETVNEDVYISLKEEGPALLMGWALKSAMVTRKTFTNAQKNYLTEVFQEGKRTGKKADPSITSKAMRANYLVLFSSPRFSKLHFGGIQLLSIFSKINGHSCFFRFFTHNAHAKQLTFHHVPKCRWNE